jgi:hypothetical protein
MKKEIVVNKRVWRCNFSATVVEEKRIILIIKACTIADSHPVKRALHTKNEDSRIRGQSNEENACNGY